MCIRKVKRAMKPSVRGLVVLEEEVISFFFYCIRLIFFYDNNEYLTLSKVNIFLKKQKQEFLSWHSRNEPN